MPYQVRLQISKCIIGAAALLAAYPLLSGEVDRAVWFWTLCLPIFAFLLFGSLHGTGRSVRTVGYIGLAYTISFVFADIPVWQGLYWVLMVLFLAGILVSIRRSSEQSL